MWEEGKVRVNDIISTVKEKYLIKKESGKVIEELILDGFSSSK